MFPLVRGRVMRSTKVDACGSPVLGPDSVIVTDGFVTATFSPQTQTADPITQTNANGDQCINDVPDGRFVNYNVTLAFCGVNFELLSQMSSQKIVLDAAGNPVGIRQNSRIKNTGAFGLEIWTGIAGQACDESGNEKFGYSVAPFIKGGTIGDIVFQNGTVDFTIQNATTRDGTGWGAGPYDVVLDEDGLPGPLLEALDTNDHLHIQVTEVAPPESADDSGQALGVAATGATAGTPGTFTPANSYAPLDLAELQASAIVADPNTAWATGERVVLRDGSLAHWTGVAWAAGAA